MEFSKRDYEVALAMGAALVGLFAFAKLHDWWINRPKVVSTPSPTSSLGAGDCNCSAGQTPVRNIDGSCTCSDLNIEVTPLGSYTSPVIAGTVGASGSVGATNFV